MDIAVPAGIGPGTTVAAGIGAKVAIGTATGAGTRAGAGVSPGVVEQLVAMVKVVLTA